MQSEAESSRVSADAGRSDYIKYKIEETPDLNELKRKAEEDAVDAQVNKKGARRARPNKVIMQLLAW